jgi:2-phospho-L-lactate guanylyltransferase
VAFFWRCIATEANVQWTVIIPVKALPNAKSRLTAASPDDAAHARLVTAMRRDTAHAARNAATVARVLIVADRSGDPTAALADAADHPRAFVADAAGTGTTLLTARAGVPLRPAFGPGSAARHARDAVAISGGPGLRTDVDTAEDLSQAERLGFGLSTRSVTADSHARCMMTK